MTKLPLWGLLMDQVSQDLKSWKPEELRWPTDEELLRIAASAIEPYESSGIAPGEYEPETECAVEAYGSELIAYAREVLARHGRSTFYSTED
jgi:hypothetical protein